MNSEGWIPVGLVASFFRVQALTQDISMVIDVSVSNVNQQWFLS